MKTYEQLPTIANVAAGNTVSVTLPVGNVYEKVFLYYEGVTESQIKNITLRINDNLVSEWPTGARLLSMEKHYQRTAVDGALVFNFTRPELHNLTQRRFFGLDTSSSQGIVTATIKLDIDSDATDPKLFGVAEKSAPVAGVPNYLTKVRRFIVPVSSIGQLDIDNIPRPTGASIAAIHMYMPDSTSSGACDLTKADLIVDNVSWHNIDAEKAANFQRIYGRDPQSEDATVIDMTLDRDVQQGLPLTSTIQDMRIRAESKATGQVEVMVEYVDQFAIGRF